jgi:hypothetical protein
MSDSPFPEFPVSFGNKENHASYSSCENREVDHCFIDFGENDIYIFISLYLFPQL